MTMVVGMFGELVNAQRAVADLVKSGYAHNRISVLMRHPARSSSDGHESGHGPLAQAANSRARHFLAGGPLAAELRGDGDALAEQRVARTLQGAGLQPAAAHFFADAICNGAILVAVHCADAGVRDARDILDSYVEPTPRPSAAGRRTASHRESGL